MINRYNNYRFNFIVIILCGQWMYCWPAVLLISIEATTLMHTILYKNLQRYKKYGDSQG